MIHLGRGGRPIVCLPCQRDEHEGCLDDRPGPDGVACHCKTCRPAPCEHCCPPPPGGQHRKGGICPGCQTQLPLAGLCDYGCPAPAAEPLAPQLPVTVELVAEHTPRTTRALRQRLTVFANLRLVEQISPTQAAARMKVRSDLTRGRYERWLASFCAEVGLPYEPWRDAFTRHYGRHYNAIGME